MIVDLFVFDGLISVMVLFGLIDRLILDNVVVFGWDGQKNVILLNLIVVFDMFGDGFVVCGFLMVLIVVNSLIKCLVVFVVCCSLF